MENKTVFLTKTVIFNRKTYPPNTEETFPAAIADEILDKDAGDLVVGMESNIPTGPTLDDLVEAAQWAINNNRLTTADKPEVAAMEEFLGVGITGQQRDEAWTTLKEREQNDDA